MIRLSVRLKTLAAMLIIGNAGAVEAQEVYDTAILEQWQPKYQRSTQRILDEVILPAMSIAEKRRLGGTPPVFFPLWSEIDARSYPLTFYAHRGAITMPIASLKFLDDLCTAYAWLQINGYGIETVSEYTAILRFGEEPPGGFPPPLEALQIPLNALDDPRVDDLALGHFVTARTFLLAHELGHVLYRHTPVSKEQSRRNEQEADRFAFELMGRTALPPIGALFFFMADAHWSHFEQNQDATHPMSGDRVRSAAAWADDPDLAQQFAALGELMDDPDIRLGFVAAGKAGNLAALAPRRPGELPSTTPTSDTPHGNDIDVFAGSYRGYFTQAPDQAEMPIELVLERSGERVDGWYAFGLGVGVIEGTVVGNRLYFEWEWADSYGKGVLYADGANSFSGTWGYREASDGAGTWVGSR